MNTILASDQVRHLWPTAAEFYLDRDNRTKLELTDLDRYSSRRVEILIEPESATDAQAQQVCLIAANLMARWARKIDIYLPANIQLSPGLKRDGHSFLGGRVLFEMRGADPFGEFNLLAPGDHRDRTHGDSLRLFIGVWSDSSFAHYSPSEHDFFIASDGMFVLGRRGSPIPGSGSYDNNPFAPAAGLAASIGVADVFKRAIGHARELWIPDFCWDLLTHELTRSKTVSRANRPVIEHTPDIGRTLLAGVGAIGSSLVYLLDMIGAVGYVTLLDRDRVETSNLNRSLLFTATHVFGNELKTVLAERYLNKSGLTVAKIDGTWSDQAEAINRDFFDVWISFTNEDGAWAQIPFQLPPVVIQGTTTSGWGFGAGRHIPRKEDCTFCRLPRPEAVFRGPCAEGEIREASISPAIRASLPFLSASSASLVLAELVKLKLPSVAKLPNDIAADLKTGLPTVVAVNRSPLATCRGCKILKSELWETRGGKGSFRHLSF